MTHSVLFHGLCCISSNKNLKSFLKCNSSPFQVFRIHNWWLVCPVRQQVHRLFPISNQFLLNVLLTIVAMFHLEVSEIILNKIFTGNQVRYPWTAGDKYFFTCGSWKSKDPVWNFNLLKQAWWLKTISKEFKSTSSHACFLLEYINCAFARVTSGSFRVIDSKLQNDRKWPWMTYES